MSICFVSARSAFARGSNHFGPISPYGWIAAEQGFTALKYDPCGKVVQRTVHDAQGALLSSVSTEYDELGLWELFEGDDDRDYVIVRRASGGIACPYQFRVIEVGAKGFVRVSDEFGSCLDPKRTALYGNALVLDMPDYIPHPELLSAAEQALGVAKKSGRHRTAAAGPAHTH